MIDIIDITGGDLVLIDSLVAKATNVLSVQLGRLEYAPDFGVDLAYFLDEKFEFQNESFRAYLLQRLAENGISVASVAETVETLYNQYTLNLAGSTETNPGLVR